MSSDSVKFRKTLRRSTHVGQYRQTLLLCNEIAGSERSAALMSSLRLSRVHVILNACRCAASTHGMMPNPTGNVGREKRGPAESPGYCISADAPSCPDVQSCLDFPSGYSDMDSVYVEKRAPRRVWHRQSMALSTELSVRPPPHRASVRASAASTLIHCGMAASLHLVCHTDSNP